MKKILFALFAVAAFASCSNTEVIELNREQISFGKAFVENSTKAIDNTYTEDNTVEMFKVWGTVQGTHTGAAAVEIFSGDEVTDISGYGDVWACDNVQYWVPNATYAFTAVVDGELNADRATIDYTVSSQKDLLWATAAAGVNDAGVVTGVNSDNLVAFNFNHALAKAYFTFQTKAAYATDKYTYEISKIQFDNAYTEGTYTVGGSWAATTKDALSFGANVALAPSKTVAVSTTSEYAKVFIPAEDMKVSFTVTMKYDGDDVSVKNYSFNVFTEDDEKFEAGHQYNFVVEFEENNQIRFTVDDVTDWTNDPNISL